tara:strand:- start:745 stop:1074 length:330 start_codon:yes stop_codon:yes gene_type:complete
MRKQKTYFVLDTTKCSGCNKEFYHLVLHPDAPKSHWCMMCFGERFGVKLMLSQKKHKLDRYTGINSFADLWEFSADHFPDLYAKTPEEITLEDYNILTGTPDWVEDQRR